VAGIFERFDGAFEEDAVLRVQDRGFASVAAKEAGVEKINLIERASGWDVIRL